MAPTQERNAYSILGLRKGSSDQEIKRAYVELVKRYDPEKHTDRFMVIKGAYDRLKDPKKRAQEDLATYNSFSGDFRFLDGEKPDPARIPTDNDVRSAQEAYKESSGSTQARDRYIQLLMQRSFHAVTRKLWVEAIRDWSEVQMVDPSHVRARHNLIHAYGVLGLSYALHGLHEEAVDLWESSLKLDPDNTELVHNLALACESSAMPEKAARYWTETIARWNARLKEEQDNEYLKELIIEAHRYHADAPPTASAPAPTVSTASNSSVPKLSTAASSSSASTDQAPRSTASSSIAAHREILKLRPDDFDAAYRIAQALYEDGNYADTIGELEKLHGKHPKNTEVLNLMGHAQLNSGQVEEAFNTWRKSLAIDPKNPTTREAIVRAHLTLGKQYRQKGFFTQALVHLKKLQQYMPNSAEVFMEIAATYDMKGDVRSASQHYQRVLDLDSKNKVARKALNDLRLRRQ